jgi:hypothetical protein
LAGPIPIRLKLRSGHLPLRERQEGAPLWSVTFVVGGNKHREHIPKESVGDVQRLVGAGRGFKEAAAEVFAANA